METSLFIICIVGLTLFVSTSVVVYILLLRKILRGIHEAEDNTTGLRQEEREIANKKIRELENMLEGYKKVTEENHKTIDALQKELMHQKGLGDKEGGSYDEWLSDEDKPDWRNPK